MKFTSLIILNYNNAHDTLSCLESIIQYNTAPIKIVVVDNASRPDEHERLLTGMTALYGDDLQYIPDAAAHRESTLPPVVLVDTGGNIGYARGNNVGLQLVDADDEVDKVMILNNDVLFVEDIVPSLIEKMGRLADCAIISPVLYKKGMQEYDLNCARSNVKVSTLIRNNLLHYYDLLRGRSLRDLNARYYLLPATSQRSGTMEIQLPSGSCMLIDKTLFREIGWFDPATFLYYEENILYKKIQAKGKRNYLSLDDRCIHLGAASTSRSKSSLFLVRASKRSEKYYVQRYSGATAPMRLLHRASTALHLALYTTQKRLQRLLGH